MTNELHLNPGAVLAGYRVHRLLSQGGMGAVYLVEQLATRKQRALKVMLPALVGDAKLRARFTQEAQIGAGIESEHVVEVIDAGIDVERGMPWLAMELLKGETLRALVERKGPLSPGLAREVLAQLCHALAAAHDLGIVHRDLKPDNIFLEAPRREGVPFTVKILDFGIAKLVSEALTQFTGAVGTPLFMAPEQMAPGAAIAPATDVWALGLIVFWMLTGRSYWEAGNSESPTPMMVLNEVAHLPLLKASQRAASLGAPDRLPAGFDAWFERAVARDSEARFRDAREARAAIAPLLAEAPPGEYVQPAPAPAPRHAERAPDPGDVDLATDAWLEKLGSEATGITGKEGEAKPAGARAAAPEAPLDASGASPAADAGAVGTSIAGVGGTAPRTARGRSPRAFAFAVAALLVLGGAGTLYLTRTRGSSAPPRQPAIGLRALEIARNPKGSEASLLASESFWASASRDFDEAVVAKDAPLRWRAAQRFTRGELLMAQGQFADAIAELRAAADIDTTWSLPHAKASAALAAAGKIEEALEEARAAERLDPSWPGAIAAAARVEAQAGRLDQAILEYRRALAAAPRDAGLLGELALAYHARRNDLEATRYAKEALDLDADLLDVRVMLAERALERRDAAEALTQSSRATGIEPNHTAALLCQADALALLGTTAEALNAYRNALTAWKRHGRKGAPEERLALVEAAIAAGELPPPRVAVEDSRSTVSADGQPAPPQAARSARLPPRSVPSAAATSEPTAPPRHVPTSPPRSTPTAPPRTVPTREFE